MYEAPGARLRLRGRSGCRVLPTQARLHRGVMKPKQTLRTVSAVADAQGPNDVVLVRWPEEESRLERLRARGTPRLLLVGENLAAPSSIDPLEDWIRLPAPAARPRSTTTVCCATETAG